MTRLFLHLFLYLVLGLLLINWTTEQLFQHTNEQQSQQEPHLIPLKNVIKHLALGQMSSAKIEQSGNTLQTKLGIDVTTVSRGNFAFLPQQLEELNSGNIVHSYGSNNSLWLYFPVDEQHLWQIGPIASNVELTPSTSFKQRLLIMLSYVMLALLIALWCRPLWRDLTTLRAATLAIGPAQNEFTNPLKNSSVLFPLGNALQNMAQRIEQLLSLQKQMTHAVGHDIRTPLARLKFALAIQNHKAEPERNEERNQERSTEQPANSQLAEMQQDIAEIELLIDEMLTYGRLQTEQPELNRESVDVFQLCDNLTDKLNRHHELKISLRCDTNTRWRCDGHLLERALQNLLTNAQRFAKQGVTLTIELEQKRLICIVEDDGEGIAEQDATKIFDPFIRLEQSRNKKSGGFGLGLAIVKRIVDWHQGEISLDRSSKGGARFTLRLPE